LHKEMEVVGHHNVASDHNVVIVRPSAVGDDRIVDLCDIKKFSAALLRIWSQSTKGRFENALQAQWLIVTHQLCRQCCSALAALIIGNRRDRRC
jgi:hypothetical protein